MKTAPCRHEWAYRPSGLPGGGISRVRVRNVYRCVHCTAVSTVDDRNVAAWEARKAIPEDRRKP